MYFKDGTHELGDKSLQDFAPANRFVYSKATSFDMFQPFVASCVPAFSFVFNLFARKCDIPLSLSHLQYLVKTFSL